MYFCKHDCILNTRITNTAVLSSTGCIRAADIGCHIIAPFVESPQGRIVPMSPRLVLLPSMHNLNPPPLLNIKPSRNTAIYFNRNIQNIQYCARDGCVNSRRELTPQLCDTLCDTLMILCPHDFVLAPRMESLS